ncbi:hypothetical protein CPB83DRAFT_842361 [Crepidotus variabilis]|uniref:DUF7704 domain-containing protein n=1 Tax=Crepidotus variabilis TaxID=179855 RepID=A0A9P6EUK4_9AGAR|nr:hypothetical protein CPB83DRAFT_842361 [Crepidotus variabilis]
MPTNASLQGYYKVLFQYLETYSLLGPIIGSLAWGPQWFYNELIPSNDPPRNDLEVNAQMATWHLVVAYTIMFTLTALAYSTVRDSLAHDLALQEKFTGVIIGALAVGDLLHTTATFRTLPLDIRYAPGSWNTTTHGNISFCVLLHLSRISWFLGVGRQRYYFGQPASASETSNQKVKI